MSDELAVEQVERQLERELVAIHVDSYGRGAERARVRVFDDVVVALLEGLEQLPNEEFLAEAGKGDAVVEIRMRYQQAIESTFRAAVERASGRRVVSFASVNKLDPNNAVEIFRLGPPVQTQLEEPDDG